MVLNTVMLLINETLSQPHKIYHVRVTSISQVCIDYNSISLDNAIRSGKLNITGIFQKLEADVRTTFPATRFLSS